MRAVDIGSIADRYQIVIVGAGPAGMAAAALAAEQGATCLLVDEGRSPGGQIYRNFTAMPERRRQALGPDYLRGGQLVGALENSDAAYLARSTVWSVDPEGRVAIGSRGSDRIIRADHVILATGAMERAMPVPGWTEPGVMGIGGAQSLLKASGLMPSGRTVLAGSGPLLWLFAQQMLELGTPPSLILDTTPAAHYAGALPHLPAFLGTPYATKGIHLLREVRRRVRVESLVRDIAVARAGHLSISYRSLRGARNFAADLVLLHQGVVPNANLASASGCRMEWDPRQALWRPLTDEWGFTSRAHISVAGDGAGIDGAVAAEFKGRIAALGALCRVGRMDETRAAERAAPHRRDLAQAMRGRRFLDVLYTPPPASRMGPDAAIACRCEEVTVGAIRKTARDLGVVGPNQMKAFLRCGMGPCQGRTCGALTSEIIAEAQGRPVGAVGLMRHRPPAKPITVGELAATVMPPE